MKTPIQKLLSQHEISPFIGGIEVTLRQVAFYFTIINLMMVSHVFYVTSPSLAAFFGSYWSFLACLGSLLAIISVFYFKFMLPSVFRFQQHQSFTLERSPIYKEIIEMRKEITEIKKLVERRVP